MVDAKSLIDRSTVRGIGALFCFNSYVAVRF